MDKIRYGFIGAGQMACGHYRCIDAIPDIELVAVADPSEASLNVFRHCLADPATLKVEGKGLMERYRELEATPPPPDDGTVRLLADYGDLLQMDDVDAVVISTPDHTHADIVVHSLAADKHVLSEKPAATSHEQLRKLEDAVKGSDRLYQVGLECRYLPVFKKMRSMIEENAIGSPRMVWCLEFRGALPGETQRQIPRRRHVRRTDGHEGVARPVARRDRPSSAIPQSPPSRSPRDPRLRARAQA